MVVMVIMALVEVHEANTIASKSSGLASFPNPLARFSQLDRAEKSVGVCHEEKIHRCEVWRKRIGPLGSLPYPLCISLAFVRCTTHAIANGDPMAKIMEKCVFDCVAKPNPVFKCVLQCYAEHHLKMDSDMENMQNP